MVRVSMREAHSAWGKEGTPRRPWDVFFLGGPHPLSPKAVEAKDPTDSVYFQAIFPLPWEPEPVHVGNRGWTPNSVPLQ